MSNAVEATYPQLRHGMDHERYAWSMLHTRPKVQLPGGKHLGVWVNVSVQHFPLNPVGKPVKLPGNMTMPYPDLRHFSLRDYGNRVGVYRFLKAFERLGTQASFAINAEAVQRFPYLMGQIKNGGFEVLGHSWNMDTPHAGGMSPDAETELVKRSLDLLRSTFNQPITGWLSPGKLQSPNTPDIIQAKGINFCADWVNDDMPYAFNTAGGQLWTLPLSTEIEDRFVVMDNQHDEASWAQQVEDSIDYLIREAKQENSARMLGLNIHPWVMGQPHRMKHLEHVLERVAGDTDIWNVSPSKLLGALTRG
jgi:allantoinase